MLTKIYPFSEPRVINLMFDKLTIIMRNHLLISEYEETLSSLRETSPRPDDIATFFIKQFPLIVFQLFNII